MGVAGIMTTRRWGRTVASGPYVTEKALQATIVAVAKLCGFRVYHTFDSRRSAPGFPDVCCVKGKSLIFIEVKTESGKLTGDQAEWLTALRPVPGVTILVVRPTGLNDCLDFLQSTGHAA